ncbi:MAG: radical SAM protein [Alsobacter sp.]
MGRAVFVALVRAPFSYKYNRTDVREEVILCQAAAYLEAVAVHHKVFDFHLQRDLSIRDICSSSPSHIVIAVRETGDNVQYALRLAHALIRLGLDNVILYGQTARLSDHPLRPTGALVVPHSEAALAACIGISATGPHFRNSLVQSPYGLNFDLAPWQRRRFRASIETSRGCPYPCRFCFINAGENHELRWQVQEPDVVMASLERYRSAGVKHAVFHDSEFVGGGRRDRSGRQALVDRLAAAVPFISFKIYNRADSLLSFGDVERLKRAGLVSVFMGVESFVQTDLDDMKKNMSVGKIFEAINILLDYGIYLDLSFILFHRSTTTTSLRTNLNHIIKLYSSSRARLLGMPHFTFSFESPWRSARGHDLSGRTYVGWDVKMKAPAVAGVVFDPTLEPLMEIFRLLAYEWSRKVVDLNLARDAASADDRKAIEAWYAGLALFCAQTMLGMLDRFDEGLLTLDTLPNARDELFCKISKSYEILPQGLRQLATYSDHAAGLSYREGSELLEMDEYWLGQIPDFPQTLSSGA